ncbi:MAG: hypothetical protein ACOC4G_07435 [Bacillota bacterium]
MGKEKIKLFFVFLLLFTVLFSFNKAGQALYISQSLTNNYTYDLEKEQTYSSYMSYQLEINRRLNLKSQRGNVYLNPQVTHGLTDNPEFALPEAYLDIYFDKFDLRVGRQSIKWGKAEGLVVTNIMSPQDFSQYPVTKMEQRFQNIDALKLNFYEGLADYEVIWIPEFKGINLQEEYLLSQFREKMGFPVDPEINYSEIEPETSLENSELGVRYSKMGRKFDYELTAAYLWDDFPVFHVQTDQQSVTITPRHHRYGSLGGSFSTTYDDFLFKGEGLLAGQKMYNVSDPDEYEEAVIAKNSLTGMLSMEYSADDLDYSFQFLQEYLLDYEEQIIQDQFSGQATASVKGQFFRNNLTGSTTLFYDLNQESLKVKPELSYDYSDDLNVKMGADYFLQEGRGSLSQGSQNVIFLQTEYLF